MEIQLTIRACYQPEVKGCFGVRLPSIVYHASRIAHLISMLNHEEENIRFVARNSLELDMHKRNISRVYHGRNCLGFEIKDDGKVSTNVKGGFGVTFDWPHLNLLACKVGIELVWEKPNAKDLMEAGSLMIFINEEFFEYHTKRQLRIKMQSLQLDKEVNVLTELKMQGTLVNLPFLDYLLSQGIFKNILFPDKLIRFWYKMRHKLYQNGMLLYQNGILLIQDVRLTDITLKAWHTCLKAAKNSRRITIILFQNKSPKFIQIYDHYFSYFFSSSYSTLWGRIDGIDGILFEFYLFTKNVAFHLLFVYSSTSSNSEKLSKGMQSSSNTSTMHLFKTLNFWECQ